MPATNAASEWSFSKIRRIKSYLRSTTGQVRLNNLMILNIYKEELDEEDLSIVSNDFVAGNEHRLSVFGMFQMLQYSHTYSYRNYTNYLQSIELSCK